MVLRGCHLLLHLYEFWIEMSISKCNCISVKVPLWQIIIMKFSTKITQLKCLKNTYYMFIWSPCHQNRLDMGMTRAGPGHRQPRQLPRSSYAGGGAKLHWLGYILMFFFMLISQWKFMVLRPSCNQLVLPIWKKRGEGLSSPSLCCLR